MEQVGKCGPHGKVWTMRGCVDHVGEGICGVLAAKGWKYDALALQVGPLSTPGK